MNKYKKKYEEIEIGGKAKAKQVAIQAYQEIEDALRTRFQFDDGLDVQNKLLLLLGTEHQIEVLSILKKHNYNERTELLFALSNLCYKFSEEQMKKILMYPTIESISYTNTSYKIQTKYGKVTLYRIADLIPEFSKYCIHREAHSVCEQFIRDYGDTKASTILLDQLFVSKRYHSIAACDEMVLDFAHNMCMPEEDFNTLFAPEIINTIDGAHVDEELDRVSKKENLGMDKSHLLVLALDKQVGK